MARGATRRPPNLTLLNPKIAARLVRKNGCWLWDGRPNHQGYGRFGQRLVHRLVWEQLRGPLPAGVILHHNSCRNKLCCNPEHLEPTTRSDHPDDRAHQLAARTTCNYGHPLDGVKTWRNRGTYRYCKTCNREGEARRRRAT